MKFSYKFLIATFLMLMIVIVANVFALEYYAWKYFNEYVATIKVQAPNLDTNFLNDILNNKKVDPKLIKEYQEISQDIDNITNSLEQFSKNPHESNTWLLESLQKSWISTKQIEQIIWTNALQSFFSSFINIFSLDSSTAEWKFIFHIIRSMAYFNLWLISIILIISYIWVLYSFRPIRAIIDNLSNIIYKKEYKNIIYRRKDEFYNLIEAINNLNKSLSLQEKIRSDFLSDLSHEIKTPITAIKCYLEWIEDGIIILDDKNINLLYNEIERLIKITNSVMEYEREESKNFGWIFVEKFNLAELVEKIIEEYKPLLSKNNQEIVSYISINYSIQADKDKFIQLLHNIFSNFIKYAWKNTSLVVKSLNRKWMHIISFSDNGKWVNSEEIPFIKEKFYKVEKSRNKTKDSGLWIWLSIIDKIVKLHNWELKINSELKKWFEIIITIPK